MPFPPRLASALLGAVASAMMVPSGMGAVMSMDQARSHWAFQPVDRRHPPGVSARDRVRTPVDAFVLADLESRGRSLAPPADPRTLLRRVYYDLIGLPPTHAEIEAFERGMSPEALSAVVDRLLASPQHGERWGRHWLDVARYADTKDLVLGLLASRVL